MTQAVVTQVDAMSFTDLVAEELRAQLARKRVSGRELARRLEVSHQWIASRTKGSVALNTAEMEAIAACLGITVGELLAGAIARASGASDGSSITARYSTTEPGSVIPFPQLEAPEPCGSAQDDLGGDGAAAQGAKGAADVIRMDRVWSSETRRTA